MHAKVLLAFYAVAISSLVLIAEALPWAQVAQGAAQLMQGVEWLGDNKDQLSDLLTKVSTTYTKLVARGPQPPGDDIFASMAFHNTTPSDKFLNESCSREEVENFIYAVRQGAVKVGDTANKFKELTEHSRRVVAMFQKGSSYDLTFNLDNSGATALGTDGWKCKIHNVAKYLAFKESKGSYKVLSFVGPYNDGKTWLLNQMAGFSGASGFDVVTNGLSLLLPDTNKDPRDTKVFVDVAGRNRLDAEVNLEDLRGRDEILEDLAIDLGDVIFCVIRKVDRSNLDYVKVLMKKVYSFQKKHLVIVHNYQLTEASEIENYIQTDIIRAFDASQDETGQIYWHQHEGHDVAHVVFGHELSECAERFNDPSLNALKGMVTYVPPNRDGDRKDVKELVRKRLQVLLRDYFQPREHISDRVRLEDGMMDTVWSSLRNQVTYWLGSAGAMISQTPHSRILDYELTFNATDAVEAADPQTSDFIMVLKNPYTLKYRTNPGPAKDEDAVPSSSYLGPCDAVIDVDLPGIKTVRGTESSSIIMPQAGEAAFATTTVGTNTFFHLSVMRDRPDHHTNSDYYKIVRNVGATSRFEPKSFKLALSAGSVVTFGETRSKCVDGCDMSSSKGEARFYVDLSSQADCGEYRNAKAEEQKKAEEAGRQKAYISQHLANETAAGKGSGG